MFASAITLSVALLSIAASASPLAGCHPNFEGAGVAVTTSPFFGEWGFDNGAVSGEFVNLEKPSGALFHVEQTGSATPSYIFKAIVPANNLAITVPQPGRSGRLALLPIEANDSWGIECQTCTPGASSIHGTVATGCTITSIRNNARCVKHDGQKAIFIAQCTGASDQLFNFHTL